MSRRDSDRRHKVIRLTREGDQESLPLELESDIPPVSTQPATNHPALQTFQDESQITIEQLQHLIHKLFGKKDAVRGVEGTFMWFMEEVGELSAALREGDQEALAFEFADVLAWLVTLANVKRIDLTAAIQEKYGTGCPRCSSTPCQCQLSAKP